MRRNDPCTTSSSSSSSYSGSSTSRLHVNCTRQMFALHRPCWFALHHINTMQYYTIQSNTMQRSDTTQYNATQGFKIQPNTMQCHQHTIQGNAHLHTSVLYRLRATQMFVLYTFSPEVRARDCTYELLHCTETVQDRCLHCTVCVGLHCVTERLQHKLSHTSSKPGNTSAFYCAVLSYNALHRLVLHCIALRGICSRPSSNTVGTVTE